MSITRTPARQGPRVGLHRIESASRDELSALQLQRLKRSLKRVYENVAHYRESFDKLGVHPDDLKDLSDLARFPTTSKQDLRENYPYGLSAMPMDALVRLHASSGTTGTPTVVLYTRHDIHVWADIMARSLHAAGVRRSDRVIVSFGYGLFTGGLGVHYGAECLGALVIPTGGGHTERQVQLIRDLEPTVLMGTPSYALVIAEQMVRQGLDPRRSSLRTTIHGAEPWTAALQTEIEAAFDCDALDLYGLSEVLGPGVAAECIETKDGLTLWEDHFYPEIVDPKTGDPVPDGQIGELVLTSLTKEAMPVIRYRTRDLTRLLPGTARVMRRIDRIMGRTDDMLIIRGVNVFPSQIEELVLGFPELAPVYELRVSKVGRLDKLTVHVEARPDAMERVGQAGADRIAKELMNKVKSYIGIACEVRVLPHGGLERALAGKAKRVVDERPKADGVRSVREASEV